MSPAASMNDGVSGGELQAAQAGIINEFNPFQSLMETEITLEFGKDLKESKIVHEELLRCNSPAARELFDKAKPLRERYSKADILRKDLKKLVSARALDETFDERDGSKKALSLITGIYENYPLKLHREKGQQIIDDAITDQVRKGNVKSAQTKAQLLKDIKDMDVRTRADLLNTSGIMVIAQRVSIYLKSVKDIENKAAMTSQIRAAAQGRYILPGFELRVVRSLVQWMYCGGQLSFDDAEHLYMLHSLSSRLGISALAELCLCTLSSDAERDIRDASSHGMSLQQVLDLGSNESGDKGVRVESANTSVQIIFAHVLADPEPPEQLVSLVTTTLAEHLDPSMWAAIAPLINHSISIRLIQAMVDRLQVKSEEVGQLHVQHESTFPATKRARLA
ncbi:hypothetical protein DE146DRAFT_751358 [Phaeosphaeria sp. MPI-PUGE-AT-0046c]|nr:hypothetical protein DE146DRAFT_751358 [Phaeosphaeria sp. MPI-PUGE-AT-0046c]